jgi:Ni/Co efflux regulator RcnB
MEVVEMKKVMLLAAVVAIIVAALALPAMANERWDNNNDNSRWDTNNNWWDNSDWWGDHDNDRNDDGLSDSQLRHKINVIQNRPGPVTNQERNHIQDLRDQIHDNDDDNEDDNDDD